MLCTQKFYFLSQEKAIKRSNNDLEWAMRFRQTGVKIFHWQFLKS